MWRRGEAREKVRPDSRVFKGGSEEKKKKKKKKKAAGDERRVGIGKCQM